jgi:hypothetical protein
MLDFVYLVTSIPALTSGVITPGVSPGSFPVNEVTEIALAP